MPNLHTIHHLQAAVRNLTFDQLKTPKVLPATHTHGPALCPATNISPLYGTVTLLAPLPFAHSTEQTSDFLQVSSLQNLPYSPHHLRQKLDLLVKFWKQVPGGAKNRV